MIEFIFRYIKVKFGEFYFILVGIVYIIFLGILVYEMM